MSEGKTLLGTTNVSLSTSAAAVTAPTDMAWASDTMVAGCQYGGEWIEWLRQKDSDSTYSTPCIETKESAPFAANPGQTVFYAKLASGTGTLYVEWYG